ncbi:hypothetical protein B0T25DRAFT_566080 [Lasiosphaeria hispida]|uniref:Uncharacterized protein n=1 Tax=Lasiosphaeria hispida TaxID=260671 RepID=A0AAJ0HLG9_9PEZI|nr:hypothetical protein B0T25DRAFT_566080 [Lasiosphaeria hispida]
MTATKPSSATGLAGTRNALVIGAKQGIGLNLAKKLKEKGWNVYASVRTLTDPQNQEIRDISQSLYVVELLQEDTIKSAAAAWGEIPLDLLIVCAGVGPLPEDMWEHTAEILVEKFRVNAVGPYLVTKHFRPALERSRAGKIITVSSNMASLTSRNDNRRGGSLGYRLSKTALNQLTVSLSRALAFEGSNITIHAIHPGWIPTTMSGFTGPDDMETQITLMADTIERLGTDDSGRFLKANGEDFPW